MPKSLMTSSTTLTWARHENDVRLTARSISYPAFSRKVHITGPAACIAVVLLAILSIWPFCDMAFIDDWSYAFMALKAARTGHLVFNGWSAPMLGIQAFWGAAWIRLAGFSFNLLRVSTLPFVAGCTYLLYRLLHSCGLTRQMVVLGVLGTLTSPLFLPLEASFMSDIPALFFLLLCFWCCQRIVESATHRRFLAWSFLLFVSGLLGGTIRQTDWLAPFVIFPVLALTAPKSRRLALWSFWLIGGASAALLDLWLNSQPNYYSLPILNTHSWLVIFICTFLNTATLSIELLSLMLPILCLTPWRKWRRVRFRWIAVTFVLFGMVYLASFLITKARPIQLIAGNIVTQWGLLIPGTEIPGAKKLVLWYPVQLVIVGVATTLFILLVRAWPEPPISLLRRSLSTSSRVFIVPYVAFAGVYLASATTRSLSLSAFDRYLIPVFPLAIILVLMALQTLGIRRVSVLSAALSFVFAAWGVAATHDYFAESRARLKATNQVVSSGVPRRLVSGGLEYDAWTELLNTGHIPNVPFAYSHGTLAPSDPRRSLTRTPFWFWSYTPNVIPSYILSLSRADDLRDSEFAPVDYRTWLPPFRRAVFIRKTRT